MARVSVVCVCSRLIKTQASSQLMLTESCMERASVAKLEARVTQ